MTDKLTREELRQFLPTHRAIKAWEDNAGVGDAALTAAAAAQASADNAAALAAQAQQDAQTALTEALQSQMSALLSEVAALRDRVNSLEQGYQL